MSDRLTRIRAAMAEGRLDAGGIEDGAIGQDRLETQWDDQDEDTDDDPAHDRADRSTNRRSDGSAGGGTAGRPDSCADRMRSGFAGDRVAVFVGSCFRFFVHDVPFVV